MNALATPVDAQCKVGVMTPTTPIRALSDHVIAWSLGRRLVVLERRGATWRMVPRMITARPAA